MQPIKQLAGIRGNCCKLQHHFIPASEHSGPVERKASATCSNCA